MNTIKDNSRVVSLRVKENIFSLDGSSYTGDWHNDKRHGYGVNKLRRDSRNEGGFLLKYTPKGFEDFSYYNLFLLRDGDWVDARPNGLIYEYWVSRGLYIGEVKEFKYQGKGTSISHWGLQYQGQYENCRKEGVFTFTDLDGNERKGEFKNGKLSQWIENKESKSE